jgi:hypothetical protein
MKSIAAKLSIFALFVVNNTLISAATFAVQNVPFPADPTFTQLLGINNSGTIAGFHGAVTAQGFTLTLPNNFTGQNFPGSVQSMVTGINNAGSTVGIFMDAGGTTHGYTDIGGVFKTVDQPGTVFNQGLGINSANTTVGYFALDKAAGQMGQSAYSQSGGVFTSINALLPVNQNSQAVGINNAGNIVGFYLPTAATSVGFLDLGGVISTIDPFGSTFTQALGINNQGEIVGFYTDAAGVQHGYVDINGLFSSFDPPGSMNTTINGLNDLGQIVGFYTDSNDNTIGFVGTPTPEPASLALFCGGLLATAFMRRKGRLAPR